MASSARFNERYSHLRFAAMVGCALLTVAQLIAAPSAQQINQTPSTSAGCRVTGIVTSGTTPLPGVAIVVRVGEAVRAATSTDTDGKFAILFGPNASYRVSADMMAFAPVEQELTLSGVPCDTTLNFQLSLRQRTAASGGGEPPIANPPTEAPRVAGRGRGAAPAAAGA